ncbi:MAG: energy transducer TonB [Sphingopyxis sp.]|uniref:energy transducer TonB n=1 Tax=Sphingopyxis sp. TaxID=1908224 RepID=UPI003D80F9E8
MTLIPLMSAMLTKSDTVAVPAGPAALVPRHGYGSGHRGHPVAALFAVGLPVGLVVAAALTPMMIDTAPKTDPILGTLIEIERPLDPPPPTPVEDAKPVERTASATDTVKPVIDTRPQTDNRVAEGPVYPEIFPIDPGLPARPADPPPVPKLVLAQLDGRFAGAFQPDYPASEQRREIEGVARVRVLIGIDGRVKAVELVSTDSPGFFAETKRRALAKWRFKPATRGGVPEESWKEMTVRFEIGNA